MITSHLKKGSQTMKAIWKVAGDWFKTIWENIKQVFSVVKDVLTGDFQGAWDGIKNIWNNATSFFRSVWEGIQNVFSNAWDAFKRIGGNIIDGIKKGITDAWESFKSWFSGLLDGLVKGVKKILGIQSPSKVFAGEVHTPGPARGAPEVGDLLAGDPDPADPQGGAHLHGLDMHRR